MKSFLLLLFLGVALSCSYNSGSGGSCIQNKRKDCPGGYYWNGATCSLINYGSNNQKCSGTSNCYGGVGMYSNGSPIGENNIQGLASYNSAAQIGGIGVSQFGLPQSYIPIINNGINFGAAPLPQTYIPVGINVKNTGLAQSYITSNSSVSPQSYIPMQIQQNQQVQGQTQTNLPTSYIPTISLPNLSQSTQIQQPYTQQQTQSQSLFSSSSHSTMPTSISLPITISVPTISSAPTTSPSSSTILSPSTSPGFVAAPVSQTIQISPISVSTISSLNINKQLHQSTNNQYLSTNCNINPC